MRVRRHTDVGAQRMQINPRKPHALRTGCLWLAITSAAVGQESSLNDLVSEALSDNSEIQATQKGYEAVRRPRVRRPLSAFVNEGRVRPTATRSAKSLDSRKL